MHVMLCLRQAVLGLPASAPPSPWSTGRDAAASRLQLTHNAHTLRHVTFNPFLPSPFLPIPPLQPPRHTNTHTRHVSVLSPRLFAPRPPCHHQCHPLILPVGPPPRHPQFVSLLLVLPSLPPCLPPFPLHHTHASDPVAARRAGGEWAHRVALRDGAVSAGEGEEGEGEYGGGNGKVSHGGRGGMKGGQEVKLKFSRRVNHTEQCLVFFFLLPRRPHYRRLEREIWFV